MISLFKQHSLKKKKKFYDMFMEKGLSMAEIGRIYGLHRVTVREHILDYQKYIEKQKEEKANT